MSALLSAPGGTQARAEATAFKTDPGARQLVDASGNQVALFRNGMLSMELGRKADDTAKWCVGENYQCSQIVVVFPHRPPHRCVSAQGSCGTGCDILQESLRK
jgi:hypothetical protein